MLRFDNSKLKLEVNILLLLFVAILIALGALGVATKADFVLAKKGEVQTTISSGVKIDDLTTPPDGPAAGTK